MRRTLYASSRNNTTRWTVRQAKFGVRGNCSNDLKCPRTAADIGISEAGISGEPPALGRYRAFAAHPHTQEFRQKCQRHSMIVLKTARSGSEWLKSLFKSAKIYTKHSNGQITKRGTVKVFFEPFGAIQFFQQCTEQQVPTLKSLVSTMPVDENLLHTLYHKATPRHRYVSCQLSYVLSQLDRIPTRV